jgi:hypothetical protein
VVDKKNKTIKMSKNEQVDIRTPRIFLRSSCIWTRARGGPTRQQDVDKKVKSMCYCDMIFFRWLLILFGSGMFQ